MREVSEVAFGSSHKGPRGPQEEPQMPPRTFSAEFRRKVVEDHLHGGRSMAALCREYQLSRNLLAHWKKQYLTQEPTPADDRRDGAQAAGGRRTHR